MEGGGELYTHSVPGRGAGITPAAPGKLQPQGILSAPPLATGRWGGGCIAKYST